jgi:hypothetical protein
MKRLSIFRHPATTALCWGIIGGLLMTLFPKLPIETWISEILMTLAMAICLLAALMTVHLGSADNKYFKLFASAFLTFVIMSVVAHLTLFLTNLSTYNLNWMEFVPILLHLAVGGLFCAVFSFFAFKRRKSF